MKISKEVRAILERRIEVTQTATGSRLAITAELDRKLYIQVAAVLGAMEAKWSRQLQVFAADAELSSRIEQALISGEVTTAKDVGFFPTPRVLAERMAEFVVRKPGMQVLEPSAGTGVLVAAAVARDAFVHCVEWDNFRSRELKDRFTIAIAVSTQRDFVEYAKDHDGRPFQMYEGILANPPFCRVGQGDHVDHLHRMIDLLSPGGRLACVMPASLLFRVDKRYVELRKRIGLFKGAKIEALPEGTFKESGTLVNTCLVQIG